MGIINEKLMSVSIKKFSTLCANNRNHPPLLFAFFATEFEATCCAAHRTLEQIFKLNYAK
jgi:hypothetical protein